MGLKKLKSIPHAYSIELWRMESNTYRLSSVCGLG